MSPTHKYYTIREVLFYESYPNSYRNWLICGFHGRKRKFRSFKFLLHRETPQPATPIFSCLLIQVKSIKVSFLARLSRFGALKPIILNINARKTFRLFLVQNLYDHALTRDHALFRKPSIIGFIDGFLTLNNSHILYSS